MESLQDTKNTDNQERNYSKRDTSGTDPNRYSSYNTVADAEQVSESVFNKKLPNLIPSLETNISNLERMLMVAAGTFLVYRAISGKEKNITQGILGGTMLARGITGYCPMYDAVEKGGFLKSKNVNIRTSITINKPVDEVYDFWRNLENLPQFMSHLESVREIDNINSEWTAKGPGGIGSISWKAQILMDEKGKLLSWHSLPGSTVDNAGKIYFKSVGSATELDITISYHAPFGVAGEAAAKWLNPLFEKMVVNDTQNLKTFLEAGTSAYYEKS